MAEIPGTKFDPHIVKVQLLYAGSERWARVVSRSIALAKNRIKIAGEYGMRCLVTKIVGQSVVEKSLSLGSIGSAGRCIDAAQRCVLDTHSDQTPIQTFFHIRKLDMVFQSDGSASSRVVHVCNDVVAG